MLLIHGMLNARGVLFFMLYCTIKFISVHVIEASRLRVDLSLIPVIRASNVRTMLTTFYRMYRFYHAAAGGYSQHRCYHRRLGLPDIPHAYQLT